MRCLDDYLEDTLGGVELQAAIGHVRDCAACRRRAEFHRHLAAALRDLPVPAPRSGFFEEAIARAQKAGGSPGARRHWQYFAGAALAASLVLGLGLGWLPNAIRTPSVNLPGVTIALHAPHTVRLALNSERDLRQATLNIALPEGIEVEGFPGQRDIRWQTDLARGVNMLALPLVAVSAQGGILVARLEHDGRRTEFSVQLRVYDTVRTGARLGNCLIWGSCSAGVEEASRA
jgi:hypothetical protein